MNKEMFEAFRADVVKALLNTDSEQTYGTLFDGAGCLCAEGVILKDVMGYEIEGSKMIENKPKDITGELNNLFDESFGRQIGSIYPAGDMVDGLPMIYLDLLDRDTEILIRSRLYRGGSNRKTVNIYELNDTCRMGFKDIAKCIEAGWDYERFMIDNSK